MLYCNESISAEVRTIVNTTTKEEFQVNQVMLGTPGPNEKSLILTSPEGTKLMRGMNRDYTIGYTNSFHPRINKFRDKKVFMLLSSKLGNQEGVSHFQVPIELQNDFHVLLHGYGMDITSQKKVVSWDYVLMLAPKDGIVCVSNNDGIKKEIYLVHEDVIVHTRPSQLLKFAQSFGLSELPCKVKIEDGKTVLDGNWVTII